MGDVNELLRQISKPPSILPFLLTSVLYLSIKPFLSKNMQLSANLSSKWLNHA
jgi:hypothetical protein